MGSAAAVPEEAKKMKAKELEAHWADLGMVIWEMAMPC
jgi:hypothetical protein